MRRLLRLFLKYALAAAVIFMLQWLPVPGVYLMLFGGMLWIGVLVHAFMIQVAYLSMRGALPRLALIVPGVFYAAGIGLGTLSDIPASRWQSQQQWLRIDKQVPAGTRDLAFADGIYIVAGQMSDQGRAFEPEKFGFALFDLAVGRMPDRRVILEPAADGRCPNGQARLANRCFTTRPTERPSSYVLIGGQGDGCAKTQKDVLRFVWGTIFPSCEPIKLHAGGDDEIVGRLSGAIILKHSYFLFPTAGCTLIDQPASWSCQWLMSPRWRGAYFGYQLGLSASSPNATAILMSALAQLRGRTDPP